jgi:calicheamicin 4-deoxy-4-thio-alpha-D-digitoxosyltransferase
MSHIGVFSLPTHGHVYPTLGCVAEMARRGHRVSYLTTTQFADLVRGFGAEPVVYESAWAYATEGSGPEARRRAAEFPLEVVRQSLAPVPAAEAHFAAAGLPDLVLYDGHMASTARVLARTWGRPGAQMWPTFASNLRFSLLMEVAKGMVEPVALPTAAVAEVSDLFAGFLYEHGMAGLDYGDLDPPGSEGLYLVFLPREFQYEGDSFGANYAFVGPCLTRRDFQGTWRPPESGAPVLLISMGTTGFATPDIFQRYILAFRGTRWHVVLAVGDLIDPAELGQLPDNIEVHRRVPQLEVLAHARLFVSHGGMGSVMESLASGVPLVLLPHTAEQIVVAHRVNRLGLGCMLDTDHDVRAEDLREVVSMVDSDESVRDRVLAMRKAITAAGGATVAADLIEKYLRDGS